MSLIRIKGKISRKGGATKFEAHLPNELVKRIEAEFDYDSVSGLVTALFLEHLKLKKGSVVDIEELIKKDG
jgi:hypothetical protein